MADYNVQMKQFNGTSFDNILPHASEALTLAGGGGATEIIAQARAGLSQIATGSYVGTGTYGRSNPTVITCGFKPKIVVFVFDSAESSTNSNVPGSSVLGATICGWQYNITTLTYGIYPNRKDIHYTQTDSGLLIHADEAYAQNNAQRFTYQWVAIG